jgi:AAA domain/Primase C terminal 2 (PriCT-2)
MHGTSDITTDFDFEPSAKNGPVSDIDTRLVKVTFFQNKSALLLRTVDLTLPQLRDEILATTGESKMQLPLLKLAIFGDKLSASNCLRTNENLNEITGIETDYDDGKISVDDAVAVMQKARLRCLIYPSVSHTLEKPRWRILLPTSRNYPPAMREKLVARINGLFGGKLAGESFTLSTAFFYGSVNNNPAHRAIVLDGDFIDLRDDLHAGSIYKDGSRVGGKVGEDPADGFDQESPRVSGNDPYADRDFIAAALAVIANADLSWEDWNRVGLAAHRATRSTGFDAFDMWSKKSKKYNDKTTTERWQSFSKSPPDQIGAPTICQMADQASPGWRETYNEAEVRRIFEDMAKRKRASDACAGGDANAGPDVDDFAVPPTVITANPFVLRDPRLIPPRDWIYGNHLIRKFASATIAPGGVGKSTLVIIEALAMVTRRPLLGITPKRRVRVWLWNGEDPLEEIERRIAAACIHFGITANELAGWLFVNSGRDTEIVIATQTRDRAVIAAPVSNALIKTITDNAIDVIIIDPFISSHRVTENDNNAIDLVAKEWTRIADVTQTAIDLVHHSRKVGKNEVTVEDGRGASALLAAVRAARTLNPMSEGEAKKVGITARRTYFKVDEGGKANLAPPPEAASWYQLESISLGNGSQIYPEGGDSVGVVVTWKWPDHIAGVTDADFAKVADAIRFGHWRASIQAAAWVGNAVAQALGLSIGNEADRAKIAGMVKAWVEAGLLVKVKRIDGIRREPKVFIEVAEKV